jgi:hypothetical protein
LNVSRTLAKNPSIILKSPVYGIKPEEFKKFQLIHNQSSNNLDEERLKSKRKSTEPNRTVKSTHHLEIANEINDNLDLFKIEITNQIRKLQRQNEKNNIPSVIEEISGFKEELKNQMEHMDKRREKDSKKLTNDVNNIKTDLHQAFKEEINRSKEYIEMLDKDMKQMQTNMSNRLETIEKRQNLQLDQFKYILTNSSSDERTKKLANKFLTNDADEFEKAKNSYLKPSSNELDKAVELLNTRKRKKTIQQKNVLTYIFILMFIGRGRG